MKKNSLLKLLSLAILVGGLAKVSTLGEKTFKSDEEFVETTKSFSVFNDHSKAFELGSPKRASEGEDLLASEVKVQISDVDENGKRSIRYVAAISSLDVDAKFVRTIYNEDGTVFQEAKELEVQYAYDSVMSGDQVVYPSSLGEGYNYFIAYTLGNVPESHWFSRIDVQVVVNEEESERKANIEGLMGLDEENVVYTETTRGSGKYTAKAKSTSITSAKVSKYYKTYDNGVATKVGTVTTLGSFGTSSSSGTKLQSIEIPDTITSLSSGALRNCIKLTSLTLPSGLTTVGSNALYGLKGLNEFHYYPKKITSSISSGTVTYNSLMKLTIYDTVESIPNYLFNSSIKTVEYKGTKAEWATLKSSLKYNSALTNASVVICSDTEEYKATFHFENASLKVSNVEYENSYEFKAYEGTKLTDPGKPVKDNEFFVGWYTSPTYEENTLFSFTSSTKLTSNCDFYAKFMEAEDGMIISKAIPLSDGYTGEVSTILTATYSYFSFTPEVTDIYYFRDTSVGYDSKVFLYEGLTEDESALLASNDDGYSNSTEGSTNKPFLGYLLEAGEGKTYTYKVGHSTKAGTMNIEFYSVAGDSLNEAEQVNSNVAIDGESAPGQKMYYKYCPKTNENISIDSFYVGTKDYARVELLDEAGNIIDYKEFTSTTQKFEASLVANTTYFISVCNKSAKELSSSQRNNCNYTFTIGAVAVETSLEYSLDQGEITVNYSLGENGQYVEEYWNEEFYEYEYTYYYFVSVEYTFIPTESFNGTFSFKDSSGYDGVGVVVNDGTTDVYKRDSNTGGYSSGSSEISFEEGKIYTIKIKAFVKSSSSTPANITKFSITKA